MEDIAVGVFLAISALLKLALSYASNGRRPQNAKLVGRVKSVLVYPLKSARALDAQEAQATTEGFTVGGLKDRRWMVLEASTMQAALGQFHHRLVAIQCHQEGSELVLSSDSMPSPLRMPVEAGPEMPRLIIGYLDQKTEVIDCGEEAAQWVDSHMKAKPGTYKMVYHSKPRQTAGMVSEWAQEAHKDDKIHLQYLFSYSVMTTSSVKDLSKRVSERRGKETNYNIRQFRPNIEVEGTEAYSEDDWREVFIGDEVMMTAVKPFDRCAFTTIDWQTGELAKDGQPLSELRRYRPPHRRYQLGPYTFTGHPICGTLLVLNRPGKVKIGDPVYAVSWEDARF